VILAITLTLLSNVPKCKSNGIAHRANARYTAETPQIWIQMVLVFQGTVSLHRRRLGILEPATFPCTSVNAHQVQESNGSIHYWSPRPYSHPRLDPLRDATSTPGTVPFTTWCSRKTCVDSRRTVLHPRFRMPTTHTDSVAASSTPPIPLREYSFNIRRIRASYCRLQR
jgi:hypothetical protein